MDESVLYLSWISERLSSCSAAFKKLYDILGSAKDIYDTSDYSTFGLTEKQTISLMNKDLSSSHSAINSAINLGFNIVPYNDERYPLKLKRISTPPPILYYKGKWVDFDRYYSVGIVGTRQPSAEALQKTRNISHSLAEKGVIIISGLAFGIDCEAHKEALKAKGFTAGISGVKAGQIYPKENSRLYSDMYKNGIVISEHSPVAKISKNSFPVRNRIISALSDIVLMMEAPKKSGAIITAENALSAKKSVFVPWGNETYNEGGNALLKKGARPLVSVVEVFECLEETDSKEYYPKRTENSLEEELKKILDSNNEFSNIISSTSDSQIFLKKATKSTEYSDITEKTGTKENEFITRSDININKIDNTSFLDAKKDPSLSSNDAVCKDVGFSDAHSLDNVSDVPEELSETEKRIYAFISTNDSVSADFIFAKLNYPKNEILTSLSMLEIYGYIIRIPGDKWKLL